LGHLYLQQGKKDRAVEAFRKAIEVSADDGKKTTEAYQGLARAYLALGKVEDAVATLKKVVEDFPKDASAREAYGDALKAKGDLEGAIAQYEEGVELSPTTQLQLALADAYARKRLAAKAEPLLAAILKDEPGHRTAKLGLADLYLAMGRYVEVEELLKPKDGDPTDTGALARLGIMHSRLQRPDKALEMLEQVAKRDPSQLEARAELGQIYPRGGDAEKAVRVLGDVLAIEPRHSLALLYTGQALYRLGKAKEAEQSFRASAQVDPSFAEPHNALGQLLEAAKRIDEAKAEYAKAVELQSNHEDAKSALKRLGGVATSPKP
jgi:tetratricopeptide (TPR) repeat protein